MTASDCHPLAAVFLTENLRLNGLTAMKYRQGQWGGELSGASGTSKVDQSAFASNDGSTALHGKFELILGSDVLYERDESGALAGFIDKHAAASAQVWIVDPHRSNRPAFNRQMAGLGFDLFQERLDRVATVSQLAYRGRLLKYWRTQT